MSRLSVDRPSLVVVAASSSGLVWRAVRTVKVPFGADPLVVLADGSEADALPGRFFLAGDEVAAAMVAERRPGASVVLVEDVTGRSLAASLGRIGVSPGFSPRERLLALCDWLRWWPEAVPAVMKLRQLDWAVVRIESKEPPQGFAAGRSGAFFRVVQAAAIRAALNQIELGASRDVVDEVLSLPAVPVIKIREVEVRRGLRLEDRFNGDLF